MISVRSNNLILKFQRFTPSVFKEIGNCKFKFVAKTQFLIKLIKQEKLESRFKKITSQIMPDRIQVKKRNWDFATEFLIPISLQPVMS